MTVRARTVVAAVLIATSLISVAALVAFNYFSAVSLLNDTERAKLVNIGTSRAATIENEIAQLNVGAVNLALDRSVRTAFVELRDGYNLVLNELSTEQSEELVDFYENQVAQATPPGEEPPALVSLVPGDARSQYLQYRYLVENPFPARFRSEVVQVGDGSTYDAAHARHHPMLKRLADARDSTGDLLLIDTRAERIVYSTNKAIDFATDLRFGPHSDTALAQATLTDLLEAGSGEAVFVDFDAYAPAGGQPVAFSLAAIRDETRVIGAVALEISSDRLTAVTTADEQWQATGLGETGEIYIVGSDRLMRSDARLAIEDPDDYLVQLDEAGFDTEIGEAATAFDTTVLIQPARTEAVESALDDEDFVGVTRNYLDQETLTVAAPLDIEGVDWVVVADVTTQEAYEPLRTYLRRVLIATLIIVPIVAIAGVYMAVRMLRPVRHILTAARRVGGGDLDVELPDASQDEFGELGQRFNEMVADLRNRESALVAADAEMTELLSAVLPKRLVERVKRGDDDVAEFVGDATIMAVSLEGLVDDATQDAEMLRNLAVEFSARLSELAGQHEIEPVHSASSQQLFAAGLGTTDVEANSALEFVAAVRVAAAAFSTANSVRVQIAAGVASGEVMAGIVGTGRLAYDVWGEPARRAVALASIAQTDQILLDTSVVDAVHAEWPLQQVEGLVNVAGESLHAWNLASRSDDGSSEAEATPSTGVSL